MIWKKKKNLIKNKTIVIDGSSLRLNRGAAAYLYSLISGLAKIKISNNFRFVLIVPNGCNYLSIIKNNKIVILRRWFVNKIIWDLLLLPFYCWLEDGDLLHSTENTSGSFLPRLLRLKMIVTIFDVSFQKAFDIVPRPNSFKQWIGYYYRKIYSRKAAKIAEIVVTVSQFAKKDIAKELEVPLNKIKVTYIGVPSKFFSPSVHRHEKKILIVTGNSSQKNFKSTLDCLQKNKEVLKGWNIIVVGISGVSCNFVHYVGELIREELLNYYDKSSILIMPSLYESFSIPLVEALSRGLFVIASDRGATPEILGGFGLLYDPTSCLELKKSLIKALHYCSLPNLMNIKKSLRYAHSFSEENLAKQTLAVYKEQLR